jgi:3-oxoacyl-[acyl-carrier protein] reductase
LHATDRLQSIYGDQIDEVMARTPSGKLGDPNDFGQVAAFLCSESAGYITGAAVPVDGGEAHGLQ